MIIGLAAGIPAGPVGALAVRRVILEGPAVGIAYGLGCACADLLYAIAAGLGLGLITEFLGRNLSWFRLAGGIVILIMGIALFFKKSGRKPVRSSNAGPFLTAFFIAVTNPVTLFSFTTLMALLIPTGFKSGLPEICLTAAGVFAGSFAWWIPLSFGTEFVKDRLKGKEFNLVKLNRMAGAVIAALGIAILAGGLFRF